MSPRPRLTILLQQRVLVNRKLDSPDPFAVVSMRLLAKRGRVARVGRRPIFEKPKPHPRRSYGLPFVVPTANLIVR